MNEKAMLFDNVFNNANRKTETTTMTKTNTAAQLPIDDGDLSDMEAIAAMLRLGHEETQLLKARLDGITEAQGAMAADLRALASDFKAAVATRQAQHAAAPAATSYAAAPAAVSADAKRVTWGLVAVQDKTVAKKAGGTFSKTVAVFAQTGSDGRPYERDIPKNLISYFKERVGQSVTLMLQKNQRGYEEIVSVG